MQTCRPSDTPVCPLNGPCTRQACQCCNICDLMILSQDKYPELEAAEAEWIWSFYMQNMFFLLFFVWVRGHVNYVPMWGEWEPQTVIPKYCMVNDGIVYVRVWFLHGKMGTFIQLWIKAFLEYRRCKDDVLCVHVCNPCCLGVCIL